VDTGTCSACQIRVGTALGQTPLYQGGKELAPILPCIGVQREDCMPATLEEIVRAKK